MFTILSAVFVGLYAAHRFEMKKLLAVGVFVGVTGAVGGALLLLEGVTLQTIKGVILSLILLYAAISDIRTRECSDYLSVMLLISAFIDCSIPAIIPTAAVTVIFALLILLIGKSKIGGADIKLMAAAMIALGIQRGLAGLTIGLTAAVIVNLCKKNKQQPFPLVPYLAGGFILSIFL